MKHFRPSLILLVGGLFLLYVGILVANNRSKMNVEDFGAAMSSADEVNVTAEWKNPGVASLTFRSSTEMATVRSFVIEKVTIDGQTCTPARVELGPLAKGAETRREFKLPKPVSASKGPVKWVVDRKIVFRDGTWFSGSLSGEIASK